MGTFLLGYVCGMSTISLIVVYADPTQGDELDPDITSAQLGRRGDPEALVGDPEGLFPFREIDRGRWFSPSKKEKRE